MQSRMKTRFINFWADFWFFAKAKNTASDEGYKLFICASLLGLVFCVLPAPSAHAQQGALYKGDQKVLDFEAASDSMLDVGKLQPSMRRTAGMKFYQQAVGENGPSLFQEQNRYFELVLRCRDLVQSAMPDYTRATFSEAELDQLLAIEEDLELARQQLLARFSQIEMDIRSRGYLRDIIARHTTMVERYATLADSLMDLLANLRSAHDSNDIVAQRDLYQEIKKYFTDNVFEYDPPLLNSQPLPVIMDIKKAPIVQLSKLRAHSTKPMALPSGQLYGYDPADLNPTIDVQFTSEITDLADSLNHSPVEIYNFVRDNFEFEPYLGSRKGSQQTLDHRRGNDCDQASLLIALLRVSGIPARYATGMIEMPIDRAMNWLGIDDPVNAASLLATAGMEVTLYYFNGEPYSIGCRRVWVEAWIPFINYRGAVNDSTGFMWVPMDPTFKQYSYKKGFNLPAETDFNAETFVNNYISTFHTQAPVEMFKQMLLAQLPAHHPGATYDDLITTRSVIRETDGILPGTLPYDLVSKDGVFSVIPSNKRYYIRFHLYSSGMDLDYTTSLPEIVRKQVTISYVGATAADQQIIDNAGGIFNVQYPYLVYLKPVLKIDGCEVARGSGQIMMGITHYSNMHFTPPTGASNQMPVVSNVIIAGNYQGIGIDTEDAIPATFNVPTTSCVEENLSQELHQSSLTYLNNVDMAGDEAARLMHQVVMNDVSEAIVENTVRVLFSGGLPITFTWTGMVVDADRKIIGPFSVDGTDDACDYMRLGGADGSIQENRLFETRYGEEAISAIKILELAADSAITVCEITYSIAAECPGISQPSYVISAINAALGQGHHVIIPKRSFKYYNWTGTGWIDIDPVTCAAGYIISGGQNGGATVQTWDVSYPNLYCVQPIGPIEVLPAAQGDLYCAESDAQWTFAVPTINYWGKDKDGNCQLLKSEGKSFPVQYTISQIATIWGAGTYTFRCGSNTTNCGCTKIQKSVTIVKIEFPSADFYLCKSGDRTMSVTVTPSSSPVTFQSSLPGIFTVSGTAPALEIHGVSAGRGIIRAALNGQECNSSKGITVVSVELAGPSTLTRGDNGAYTATVTPSGLNPAFEWKFTGNGATIARTTGAVNTWNGTMVASGLVEVKATIGEEECKTDMAVAISPRSWNADVQAPSVNRGWGSSPTVPANLGNATPTQNPSWNLTPNQLVVTKIADNGPNHGFTYVAAPPVNHSMSININQYLCNPSSAFSLAQGNAGDIQVIPVGRGLANQTAVTPGPNGVLNTSPGGDDTVLGVSILTGPDGICNTVRVSDDIQVIPVGQGLANSTIVTVGLSGRLNIAADPATDDATGASDIKSGPNGVANTAIDNRAEATQATLLNAVERHEGTPGNSAEDSHWTRWYNIEAGDLDMNAEAEDEIGVGTVGQLQANVVGLLNAIGGRMAAAWNGSGEPSGYLPGGTTIDFRYPDPSFPAY